MERYQELSMKILRDTNLLDTQTRSFQYTSLVKEVTESVVQFAQAKILSESDFIASLEDALDILEGLFASLEPYRNSIDDEKAFWERQFINPQSYLNSTDEKQKIVGTTNGLFDEYLHRYIYHPAMHCETLTRKILDICLYEDMANVLITLKYDSKKRNFISPSKKYLFGKWLIELTQFSMFLVIGAALYSSSKDLLTPYVMIYLYWRYKIFASSSLRTGAIDLYNRTMNRYLLSDGLYTHDQILNDLLHCERKYGVRFKPAIYKIIELLRL